MQEYFFSEVRLKQKKYIFWAWEQKLADLVLLGGPSQFWQLRFWQWPPSLLCFTDLPLQRQVLPAICSHFAAHCSGYRLLLLLLSTRQTHQVQIAPSATHTQTNVAPIVSCGNHNHNYGLRLWAALLLSAKLTAQHSRFSVAYWSLNRQISMAMTLTDSMTGWLVHLQCPLGRPEFGASEEWLPYCSLVSLSLLHLTNVPSSEVLLCSEMTQSRQ